MSQERDALVRTYLEKYKDLPTMSLAKLIYKEHPALFSSLENTRSFIRYRRGNKGEVHRQVGKSKFKDLYRKNGKAGFSTPIPKSIAKPPKDIKLPSGRYAIISDVHVPYHDDNALNACLDYIDKQGIDHIVLNGDIADFFSISRWEKNPEERNLARELMLVRQFLSHLRERYPKTRIFYKIGNHEERWEKYMWSKAPEICGVTDFEMYNLLEFRKWGIEEVSGRQRMKAGKNLTIIHGHEIFGSAAPVNFARTLQTNLGVCAIAGHRHQTSQHCFKTADDKYVHCWSLGCLCDMRPEYATFNKWNHGFAMMDLDKDDFIIENKRIIKGNIV